jgi:hypothetical protein
LPESVYEDIPITYETSTFDSIYNSRPKQYQEYIKIIPATTTELNNLSVDREIVVRQDGHGFRFRIYGEELLSNYDSAPISTLSDITFDVFLDTVYDTTIKATTSPYSGGQSARKNPTDIFRDEIRIDIQSASDVYALPYDGIQISALSEYPISGTLYDRQLSAETFGTTYPSINTVSDYTTYAKIAGTVSSANAEFSTLSISAFSSTPVSYLNSSSLSELAPIVIGSGTNFVSDFSLGSVFVANNEYFIVESIANTTFMTTDRLPASPFSGVVAYRIPA